VLLEESGDSDITDGLGVYRILTRADTTAASITGPCIESQFVDEVILVSGEINVYDYSVGAPDYSSAPSSVNIAVHYDVTDTSIITLSNSGSGALSFTIESNEASPAYDWLTAVPESGEIPVGESLEVLLLVRPDSQQGSESEFFGNARIRSNSCPDSIDEIPVTALALAADEPPASAVQKFALHPAFPNPFNAETTLRFDLAQAEFVTLNLYDISGRLVRTLSAELFAAGSHAYKLSLHDSPSGVYLLSLQSTSFSAAQKVVLLK
jgi:hypothetical protein